jgi:hypothetical protein
MTLNSIISYMYIPTCTHVLQTLVLMAALNAIGDIQHIVGGKKTPIIAWTRRQNVHCLKYGHLSIADYKTLHIIQFGMYSCQTMMSILNVGLFRRIWSGCFA